jgi:hypothetical protein
MKFSVQPTAQGYEAKWWLDDENATIFRFELPENTVSTWRLASKKLGSGSF